MKKSLLITTFVLALAFAFPAAAAVPDGASYEQAFFKSADGTELHADILKPAGLKPGQRTPVLMTITPYGAHASGGNPANEPPSYPWLDVVKELKGWERGYTAIVVDVRGFGGSEGCWQNTGALEQADSKAAVEWAASQPWSNGKVALSGLSYDGLTAIQAMALDAKGLVGVAAWSGVVDTYRALYSGGVPSWSVPAFPYVYNLTANNDPGTIYDDPAYWENWASRAIQGCSGSQLTELRNPDGAAPYWRERDLLARAADSGVPFWASQGFLDIQVPPDQTTSLYTRLKKTRGLLLGQFVHYDPIFHPAERIGQDRVAAISRFVDEVLLGKKAPRADRIVYVQEAPSLRWRTESAWPPVDARAFELTLRPGTYRDTSGNASGDNVYSTFFPVIPAERYPATGQGTWTFTQPLSHAVHLAGSPHMRASATGPAEARFVALLYDVAPDGKALLITRGASLLRDGKVEFDLYPQDWRLEPGHRLGVLISGADDSYYAIHEGTGAGVSVEAGSLRIPTLRLVRDSFVKGGPGDSWEQVKRPIAVDEGVIEERSVTATLPPRQIRPLGLRVRPSRVTAGRKTKFEIRVSSAARPVSAAQVRFCNKRARTNRRGLARLRCRFGRPGTRQIRVTKPGYARATGKVLVRSAHRKTPELGNRAP